MVAAALLALVVVGVLGLVLMARWESRMAASAPRRPALFAVADEIRAARAARVTADEPLRSWRRVRGLRPVPTQG